MNHPDIFPTPSVLPLKSAANALQASEKTFSTADIGEILLHLDNYHYQAGELASECMLLFSEAIELQDDYIAFADFGKSGCADRNMINCLRDIKVIEIANLAAAATALYKRHECFFMNDFTHLLVKEHAPQQLTINFHEEENENYGRGGGWILKFEKNADAVYRFLQSTRAEAKRLIGYIAGQKNCKFTVY